MSYFDDVVEPSLYKEPPFRKEIERDVVRNVLNIPTNAQHLRWICKDSTTTTIGDMTDNHLNNAHNLLGRRIGTPQEKETDCMFYAFLRAEINRRENDKQ